MAYKCVKCGKYVSKDALLCKHCGQKNPAISIEPKTTTKRLSENKKLLSNHADNIWQIYCPNCGNQLTMGKEFKKEENLHCPICQTNFVNPLRPVAGRENELDMKKLKWVGLFFCVILFTGLYFAINKKEEAKTTTQELASIRLENDSKGSDLSLLKNDKEENGSVSLNNDNNKENTQASSQNEATEYVVTNATIETKKALAESEYSIVHRWMETNMGTTSKECRIEKIKKNGKYRILTGDIYFTCYPKKITRNSNYVFHNSHLYNGDYFNLAIGTPIYYIPKMETNANGIVNGILVIQADGSAQLYMNDYNPNFYEIFTELRPI